jgi:hypothetical protein
VSVGDDEAFQLAPFPIPPLFANQVTHVFLKRKGGKANSAILVTGVQGDSQFEQTCEARQVDAAMHCEKMFAFYNIKDMEDKMAGARGEEANRLKQSAIQLSKESGVICAFTALYTVLEGVEMHLQPSLGQERFGLTMQPFTQAQCRGQEKFRSVSRQCYGDTSASLQQGMNRGAAIDLMVDCQSSARSGFRTPGAVKRSRSLPWTGIIAIIAVLIIILALGLGFGLRSSGAISR